MKRYLWLIVFLAAAISIAGCGRKRGVEGEAIGDVRFGRKGPILAKIDDKVITLDEFNERIEKLPDNIKVIAETNKPAYLDNLVLEALLYKEGLRKGLDKDEEIRELLKEARKRIIIARLAKEEVEDKVTLSEKEIKDYYQENKEKFISPETLRASHILVDTLDEAVEVSDKLNAGALFEELARKYSKDATSKRGGDIGYFSEGQMVPEFEDACFKLKVGEISGPVKTQFGYHIIKLADRREPESLEFDAVKDRIEEALKAEKGRTLFGDLITRLKERANITINSELIEPQERLEESPPDEVPQEG